MNILVTGSDGFIGRNLSIFLNEAGFDEISTITLEDSKDDILVKVEAADFIYHLAGINRPKNEDEFKKGNTDLTTLIVNQLIKLNKKTPIVLTSSIQAELDNAYGVSKAGAEEVLTIYQNKTGAEVYIYRLPNVFGKWCRPNYNSAVATFCYNTLNALPITIHNPDAPLNLVYIDDVCENFVRLLDDSIVNSSHCEISPIYKTTVGEVAGLLTKFKDSRNNLVTESVGTEFVRALYSTYMSYLEPEQFAYSVTRHGDDRGTFVEMLKTQDSGQFSFFTAYPGITRGGHYHHTKTEKFLVIKGQASFKFQHIVTGESYELLVNGEESKIVETAPGWSHDVTNIGDSELIVMLWANEMFDREKPDTFTKPL
ncbi:UDP-2-acetamido-2,6-dideoxy-beta-L-talose 4-dehydrogenase [Shewanella hanedai]|uniref:SDR family oxidoreductase n=1 Tax=Shewanella hanedai TaxID=25 RepID=A0A553JTA8_SHEHA|nr:NAD-dependent epimerase/dehydratase family protein [Shewanella hanedai]TRY15693.1 SDR family oxidoreductase [Shewanella hanedai]GGI71316.1 UDP-2-acetamido-2,6-dideoxy-beta-L-talose 4-dehydrogenase [Shewanella hanedai]